MTKEEIIHKMGIEIVKKQNQYIFDKVNEIRVKTGFDVYVYQEELVRDLKKLDEYEELKKENADLKIIDKSHQDLVGQLNVKIKQLEADNNQLKIYIKELQSITAFLDGIE